jgi:hypothetical protein
MADRNGWADALRLHQSAAAEYARSAGALAEDAWAAPITEGKWSPAEITEHLIRAYEVLLRELSGGPGMALRTGPLQRVLLRLLLVPRLLRGTPFPLGARAPRETRPVGMIDQQHALARFVNLADQFQAAVQDARARNPRQRLTHAYFGASPLQDSVVLCARHILHHRQQLPTPPVECPGSG